MRLRALGRSARSTGLVLLVVLVAAPEASAQTSPSAQCSIDADCGGGGVCGGPRCQGGRCVDGGAPVCSGPESASYIVRFQASEDASSYLVYLRTEKGAFGQPIELGALAPAADGVVSARIEGLDTSQTWIVALAARGPGGESVLSNPLLIVATRCAVGCESADPCTDHVCEAGVCGLVPAPSGTLCNDGNAATVADQCSLGRCAGRVPQCRADADCADTDACNGAERCLDFQCHEGAPLHCPASSACSASGCDPAAGCVQTREPDGAACEADPFGVCSAGSCVAVQCRSAGDCAAGHSCESGRCAAVTPGAQPCPEPGVCQVAARQGSRCALQPAPDGTSCAAGGSGTAGGECRAGACVGAVQCSALGAPRTVHLGWTASPATSMTLQWDGPLRAEPRLRVRGPNASWSVLEPRVQEQVACEARYAVQLEGLRADTRYEYALQYEDARGVRWSAERAFRTAPAAGAAVPRYTVAFAAGIGIDGAPRSPHAARVLRAIAAHAPAAWLGGGGYAFAPDAAALGISATAAIERFLAQLLPISARAPFVPVYGRSELAGGESVAYYRRRHASLERGAPEPGMFSFDAGTVHYVGLHAPEARWLESGTPQGRSQLAWLEADLARARTRGQRFAVVYLHLDPYGTYRGPGNLTPAARSSLKAVLQRHRVDLVLSGGAPGFERTHPMRAGVATVQLPARGAALLERASQLPPLRVLAAEQPTRGEGVLYLRTGSGGRDDYRSWGPSAPPPWLAARDATRPAYVLLQQEQHTLTVTVMGVPASGNAGVLDQFTLR